MVQLSSLFVVALVASTISGIPLPKHRPKSRHTEFGLPVGPVRPATPSINPLFMGPGPVQITADSFITTTSTAASDPTDTGRTRNHNNTNDSPDIGVISVNSTDFFTISITVSTATKMANNSSPTNSAVPDRTIEKGDKKVKRRNKSDGVKQEDGTAIDGDPSTVNPPDSSPAPLDSTGSSAAVPGKVKGKQKGKSGGGGINSGDPSTASFGDSFPTPIDSTDSLAPTTPPAVPLVVPTTSVDSFAPSLLSAASFAAPTSPVDSATTPIISANPSAATD